MRALSLLVLAFTLTACDAMTGLATLQLVAAGPSTAVSATAETWPASVAPLELATAALASPAVTPFMSCYAGTCRFAHLTLDDITVPQGATWRLDDVVVMGSITVAPGARLDAVNVTVHGDLLADRAADVTLLASDVWGRVDLRAGGRVDVRGSAVGGTAIVIAHSGRVRLEGNVFTTAPRTAGNLAGLTLRHNVVLGS